MDLLGSDPLLNKLVGSYLTGQRLQKRLMVNEANVSSPGWMEPLLGPELRY